MQGATAAYPVAVILAVAHDSPAVCIVQYGTGAALFDCGIASGVGCGHGVPLISSQPAFAVARLGCALLHLAFFFSSLMSCSCNSVAAYGGKSASSARGGEPRRSSTCARCCGGFFGHSPLVRPFNLRCELFPFQLLYSLLQYFKRAVFANYSFLLIWDLELYIYLVVFRAVHEIPECFSDAAKYLAAFYSLPASVAGVGVDFRFLDAHQSSPIG